MKVSIWRPNLESQGRDTDLYVNGGGLQTSQAIFGDVISCNSSRMFSATLVRSGAPE